MLKCFCGRKLSCSNCIFHSYVFCKQSSTYSPKMSYFKHDWNWTFLLLKVVNKSKARKNRFRGKCLQVSRKNEEILQHKSSVIKPVQAWSGWFINNVAQTSWNVKIQWMEGTAGFETIQVNFLNRDTDGGIIPVSKVDWTGLETHHDTFHIVVKRKRCYILM